MTRRSAVALACLFAVAMGAFSSSSGCGGTRPRTGSETNSLTSCDATCADGLTCVCGVCTRLCTDDDECSSLASGAECVSEFPGATGEACTADEEAFCDKTCSGDADCASLGESFECQAGSCRLPTEDVVPDACPATAVATGTNARTVEVGGTTRSYLLHVPESFTGDTAVPLVIDFHPLSGSATLAAASSGYRELAEQEGFIVAYPEGIDTAWNIGVCCTESRDVDDVAFARSLVAQIQTEACIDGTRVYAVGAVMGGGMAYHLACNAADLFAGIAPSSFDLLAEEDQPCEPEEPVTVISFRSTEDAVVPYEGGAEPAPNLPGVTMNFLGAVATFERWAELNGCTGSPSTADADGCSTYSNCADDVEVTLCTVDGAATLGSAERAWETLSRHRNP